MKTTLLTAALAAATIAVSSGAFANGYGSHGRYDGSSAPVYKPEPRFQAASDDYRSSRRDYRSNDTYRPVWRPYRNGY